MYMTRCIFDAFKVDTLSPPYDTGIARIYYPARYSGSLQEQTTGTIPFDDRVPPCPVVILLQGINTDPSSYRWLAELLAPAGIVTVTYQLVAQEIPGAVAATPGINLQALTPDQFGKHPSAIAVPAILSMLARLNGNGVLAGNLDLSRIAFGGHSAGGTMALLNADQGWFPAIRAVFAYGAHTAGSTALGWPEETILPINPEIPVLLIGGLQDGCVAQSAHRYGVHTASATALVEQTFDHAVAENNGRNTLLLVDNANHFSICSPEDRTCGRGYIDETVSSTEGHAVIGQAIGSFLTRVFCVPEELQHTFPELDTLHQTPVNTLRHK